LSKDRTETKNLADLFPELTALMKNEWGKWEKEIIIKKSTNKENSPSGE
jgi:hypothetical protein